MATQERSPSLLLGQSWANWADKMSITDGNDDEEEEKANANDDGDCMKLNKKDMDLFGFCPSRDEFMLVQCEICNMLLKPQALKRHVESRHGQIPVVLSPPQQTISSKVLNSELAKTLSLPVTGFGKTATTNKPPMKASLKQVASTVRLLGNTAVSTDNGNANCHVNSSSQMFRKGNTNPVVKMERIPKEVASLKKVTTTSTSLTNSPSADVTSSSPTLAITTTSTYAADRKAVLSLSASSKTLTNGTMLKQALGTNLSTVASISIVPVSTMATQLLALTTTTTSITYTRPTTASVTSTMATTSVCVVSRSGKPVPTAVLSSALAAKLTATSSPVRVSSIMTTTSKSKKSPKERKFLPCKDREFDPNKHCGVVTDDSGKPCTRSLTCKTHALGLRRAVKGRKKSFDELLKDHKAAKEAMLKAKAEEQAAANGDTTTRAPTIVTAVTSPAALAAVSAFKLGPSELSVHRDVKSAATALLSHTTVPRTVSSHRPAFNAVFQKLTPGGTFPSSFTIKEEVTPAADAGRRVSQNKEAGLSRTSERDDSPQDKHDVSSLAHHPRPAAACTFGARKAGGGCALFSRRTDMVRAAFLSALERQINPPPHKKLCVESKLPKEPQMTVNSKDPYEFNMVDSGLAHQRQTVSFTIGGPVNATTGLLGKPILRQKAKSLSSHTLSVTGLAVSTAAPTTIAIPTLAAALMKSKVPDSSAAGSSAGLARGAVSLTHSLNNQSVKRKRGGSSNSSAGSSTIQLQGGGVGLTVGAGVGLTGVDGSRVTQQSALLTPASSMSSLSASTPLTAITIPSINLANAATLGLSATLPSSKSQGQKTNNFKDFSLVLTGIDPSLVNGQYFNITGAQLAELAAAQAVNATAEDKNIKRSRLAATKQNAHKISGTLETLRALQGSSLLTAVPPNAVLVDGSLQGAVLTPVSFSGGGNGAGSSTLVTLTSSTITTTQSPSSITVTPSSLFRTVSEGGAAQQVTLSTPSFHNGITPSAGDKLHSAPGSSSHSQQQQLTNSLQSHIAATAKTLQAPGLMSGTPLCGSTGLTQLTQLKPGMVNISKAGKMSMQPVSVTIPLLNTMGLATLPPAPHSNPHPHTPSALLVTTPTDDGRGGGGMGGGSKTEIHIQPHLANTSSGMIS